MNKVLSTPKAVLEAMARSVSPDIYKSFTARYTKDIALEVRSFCWSGWGYMHDGNFFLSL